MSEKYVSSKTLQLKSRTMQQWCPLRAYQKCRTSALPADLRNQNLHFNEIPCRLICTLVGCALHKIRYFVFLGFSNNLFPYLFLVFELTKNSSVCGRQLLC